MLDIRFYWLTKYNCERSVYKSMARMIVSVYIAVKKQQFYVTKNLEHFKVVFISG